jgi:hypothetical protein
MSQRQEEKVAEDIGGRTVAGSGAGRTSGGGDVRKRAELRVECKVTEKDYYVLQYVDLDKIRRQAIQGGLEYPVLHLRFAVPRSSTFEYSIEPGCAKAGCRVFVTERKRIKLSLAEIQRELLGDSEIGVAFKVGQEYQYWRIRQWPVFLAELETLC